MTSKASEPAKPAVRAGMPQDGMAHAMRRAAFAVSRAGGPDVVGELVRDLAAILQVDVAFAAVFSNDERTHVRTLGAQLDGRTLRNFDYPLAGSPCAEVVGREFRFVPRGVAARFRDDTIFAAKHMDCYAAYPLTDSAGDPLGLLVAMNRRPIEDAELAESMLKIFAVRIAAEIERGRAEEGLRSAALTVSNARGEGVFPELVRYLATILKTEIAFIALTKSDDPCRLEMLALYMDGEIRENFDYDVRGTPCESVIGQEYRAYPSGLNRLFPDDRDYAAIRAESYAGFPLRDSRGTPLGLIAVVSRKPMSRAERVESMLQIFAVRASAEIERSRAEQALRESEASYRAIFEAAEDAILIHDWDTGAILDVNPKASETFGYSCEEMRGISVGQISSGVPPFTLADAARWFGKAKSHGSVQFEWHRRNKDGSLHWDEVRLKSTVIGGHRRILASAREITERKLAEEALRASEEQYRAIFNASADALMLWNSRLQRVDVNPAHEKIFGFAREEVVGRGFEGLSYPEEFVRPRIEMVRRALAGEACRVELEALRKDGQRIITELRTIPFLHRGEPHVLQIARDITERSRAEEERAKLESQLRQAQKMEAIGHLTGGIAHDFNNILTSVMGYIALGAERAHEQGDAKLEGYFGQIDRAAQRARDLIQQMLTFSRGQRGQRSAISLARLVSESLGLLRSSLPTTINLEDRLDADAPPAMIDPVQIEQVFLNLCINARDAIEGAGRIRAEVRAVDRAGAVCGSCKGTFAGRYVELSVCDSGPGIRQEVLDRMFEPFFSTKDVGHGSGMGLAMVHGIVHEHGGHILVETSPDQGATFRIVLPVVSEPAARPGVDPPGAATQSRRPQLHGRVLVVDDEQMVAEFMGELLSGWALEATVMRDPIEAESWFARDPSRVDLVITDQTMPKTTGLELARRLRSLRPDLPVILYTGYTEKITQGVLDSHGVGALLQKPIQPAALLELLGRHLRQG